MTARARPIMFTWRDSAHVEPGAWMERDTAAESTPCGVISVGWQLEADDDRVVLASNLTEQGHASGVFVVPRECIDVVYRLQPVGRSRTGSPPWRGWLSRWWRGGES